MEPSDCRLMPSSGMFSLIPLFHFFSVCSLPEKEPWPFYGEPQSHSPVGGEGLHFHETQKLHN